MRFLLGALIVLLIAAVASATPPDVTLAEVAQAKARAFLTLQKIHRGENGTATTDAEGRLAKAKAEREHKPVFTWVNGEPTEAIVKAFPGAVHVQVPDCRGDRSPKLIFQGHDGEYFVNRSALGSWSPEQIRRLMQSNGSPANCPDGQCPLKR